MEYFQSIDKDYLLQFLITKSDVLYCVILVEITP